MADLLEQKDIQPKDILQFVETRAERALEVLREIIDVPEYDSAQLMQAIGSANTVPGTGTATWIGSSSGSLGFLAGNAQAQGGFNG